MSSRLVSAVLLLASAIVVSGCSLFPAPVSTAGRADMQGHPWTQFTDSQTRATFQLPGRPKVSNREVSGERFRTYAVQVNPATGMIVMAGAFPGRPTTAALRASAQGARTSMPKGIGCGALRDYREFHRGNRLVAEFRFHCTEKKTKLAGWVRMRVVLMPGGLLVAGTSTATRPTQEADADARAQRLHRRLLGSLRYS